MTPIIENYGVKHGIKLSAKNVGGTEIIDSDPLYMAIFFVNIFKILTEPVLNWQDLYI